VKEASDVDTASPMLWRLLLFRECEWIDDCMDAWYPVGSAAAALWPLVLGRVLLDGCELGWELEAEAEAEVSSPWMWRKKRGNDGMQPTRMVPQYSTILW